MPNYILTTDNNRGDMDPLDQQVIADLKNIADCPLDKLLDKNGNDVWLFPEQDDRYGDKIEKEVIFSLNRLKRTITTGNIMGFVGYGDTQLTIRSRFSQNGNNDWFMQYMLQKVFAVNIFDLDHGHGFDNVLSIAGFLFPYYLQKALSLGVYQEYQTIEHNDSRVRGVIDFNVHIRNNYPFKNGKISCSTRELCADNELNQLIRHTIEFLQSQKITNKILHSTYITQEYVKQIIDATPSYRKRDLPKVMASNIKTSIPPFYNAYRPLQELCLQILRHDKISYAKQEKRIHGILFDGAWLWEEYLNLTLSKAGFKHPNNKKKTDPIHPFVGIPNKYKRYPDFMKDDIIADAKYKRILDMPKDNDLYYEYVQHDDLNQMISYMHITKSNKGIFICPTAIDSIDPNNGDFYRPDQIIFRTNELCEYKVGDLEGYGGTIFIMGVNIPNIFPTYNEFVHYMNNVENLLLDTLTTKVG